MMTIYLYAQTLVIAAGILYWLQQGYRRRRPFWARDSWLRFTAVCGIGLLFVLAPAGLELVEAHGIITTREMSTDGRGLLALSMLALMLAGAIVSVMSVGWFAYGEPTHPFPSLRHHERAED